MFGPVVLGVSLGAPCALRFRRGAGGTRAIRRRALAPRSAYLLSGAARATWQHSKAATQLGLTIPQSLLLRSDELSQ